MASRRRQTSASPIIGFYVRLPDSSVQTIPTGLSLDYHTPLLLVIFLAEKLACRATMLCKNPRA